jgi:hypothetical protein
MAVMPAAMRCRSSTSAGLMLPPAHGGNPRVYLCYCVELYNVTAASTWQVGHVLVSRRYSMLMMMMLLSEASGAVGFTFAFVGVGRGAEPQVGQQRRQRRRG